MTPRLSSGLAWLLRWLDPLLLLAITPLLLFPTVRPTWTAAGLVALAVILLMRGLVCREPWPVTPFNGALLLFVLAIALAVWASAMMELTLPKLAGLVLGLAAFRTLGLSVRDRRTLAWGLAALALVGLGVWAVGVLGTGWTTKVGLLRPLVRSLPRLLTDLPGAPDSGINANQLAGGLMIYLPLALACAAGWVQARRWGPALLATAGLALVIGTLVLTQSRGGWVGGAAGILALLLLAGLRSRRRWLRIAGIAAPVLALVAAAIVLASVGPDRISATLFGQESSALEQTVGQLTLAGRVEIWSRALYAIQDFPFTGTGLGTFRRVVHLLYPLFTISPDLDIAHAHNMFLQVAVDLGLPGLIAYLALLWLAGVTAWRAARTSDPLVRPIALGLLAGLIGLHVYGLTDALAPGSKPGLVFWMALGLLAALPQSGTDRTWRKV